MIYKRGAVYWYEFRIARVRHRGSTGLKNKRAAQEFHDDLQARKKREANGLEVQIQSKQKIYELLDEYLEFCKIDLRKSTVNQKRNCFSQVKKVIKDGPLQTLSPENVKALQTYGRKVGWEHSTINVYHDQLLAFARWATQEKHFNFNPIADIPRLSVPQPVDKLISPEELERLLKVVPTFLAEIIWVDWQMGVRLSNVSSLRYDQINFNTKTIYYAPGEMKKGKQVEIDMDPELADWLTKRRAAHRFDTHVWPSPCQTRKHYSSGYISSLFTKCARKVGIDASFHSIRHTFATNWINSGVSLFMTGKLLQHNSARSTERYVHVADAKSQRLAKKRVTRITELPKLKVVG